METPLPDQYQALKHGCALIDRSAQGRLELTGADRHRFLNAYVTCDVKGLAPGASCYGFFTSAQGRILADAVVFALAGRLWVEVPAGHEEALLRHLQKYILSDRVEVRVLAGRAPFALVGPASGAVEVEADLPVSRAHPFGVPGLTLWVPAAEAPQIKSRLLEDGRVVEAGLEALEVVRTEAGVPWFGRDFGPENFPQETGREDAVSYTKGCYLGQEVVARIHYRGGVQKILRRLAFQPGQAPESGTTLLHEDRAAGVLGTVVDSPAYGHPIGLAILHQRAAEAGTRLRFAGGEAVVLASPPRE
jgi:aminomethyltransferase